MREPGLHFEVARRRGSVPALRSDRTAVIGLFERGPMEMPIEIRSREHLHQVFGCPLPGMLGPLAARACLDNGAELLIVTRVVPAHDARPATGLLRWIGLAPGAPGLPIVAAWPGVAGDRIEITARLAMRAVERLTLVGTATGVEIVDDAAARAVVDRPVRLRFDGGAQWVTVRAPAGAPALVPALPASTPPGAVVAEVYDPRFALSIRAAGIAPLEITDLDARDLDGLRARLAGSPIDVGPGAMASPGIELPLQGERAHLSGGDDGLAWGADRGAAVFELAESFRRALRALEIEGLADVVIAPDLWGRIWRTKGVDVVCLEASDAVTLSDELVRHAARMRERVALVDAPLGGPDGLAPASVAELEMWRDARVIELGADRDFAMAIAPWAREPSSIVHRGDRTMLVPASSFVAGQLARVARARGPWISAADEPLRGAIGTSHALDASERVRVQHAGIVPLIARSDGVVAAGVRSLAHPDRPAWSFLSSRRLFNYLRRALTPLGRSYAFEPSSPPTWIALRRDLDAMLRDLFDRGALAGQTPEEAFSVRVDESLNPEAERERGVMTAEIRVAPALPLEQLIVHLIVGGGAQRIEEVAR